MEERNVPRNLPPSDDPYWEHSDKETHPEPRDRECRHNFIHRTAQEVECLNCGIGFFLSPGWRVREGHIYSDKDKLAV